MLTSKRYDRGEPRGSDGRIKLITLLLHGDGPQGAGAATPIDEGTGRTNVDGMAGRAAVRARNGQRGLEWRLMIHYHES